MDILFCDRCHESIPDADLETGKAVRVGGRVLHVPCAFRRVLPGPGRWVPVALALLAVAGAAYAVVRAEHADKPEPADMPAAWRERLADDVDARVRGAVTAALDKQRIDIQHDLDARVQKSADDVEGRIRTAVAESSGKLDGKVTAFTDATLRRFESLDQHMVEITDWVKQVKANPPHAEATVAVAPPPPAATPPPSGPAAPPSGPVAPPPTAGSGSTPLDPEAQRRHDDELSKWVAALKDPNPGISFSATYKLKDLKDLRAVPALIDTLKTYKDFYTRLGAAAALGELKACDAVPALLDALDDKEDLVQQQAAEALTSVTGQDPAFRVGLTKKERKAIKEQWSRWWKENETEVRRRLNQPAAPGKAG